MPDPREDSVHWRSGLRREWLDHPIPWTWAGDICVTMLWKRCDGKASGASSFSFWMRFLSFSMHGKPDLIRIDTGRDESRHDAGSKDQAWPFCFAGFFLSHGFAKPWWGHLRCEPRPSGQVIHMCNHRIKSYMRPLASIFAGSTFLPSRACERAVVMRAAWQSQDKNEFSSI